MIGTYKMIARSFGSRVGGVRIIFRSLQKEFSAVSMMMLRGGFSGERRFKPLGIGKLKRTVLLIGRDMIEDFTFVSLGSLFPSATGCLKQRECAHHIGTGEEEGVKNRTVNMAFGCQMYHAIHFILLHQHFHLLEIADIPFHEKVVGGILHVREVGEIPGIRKFIKADNSIVGIFIHEESHHMVADKSGTAGDEYIALEFCHR